MNATTHIFHRTLLVISFQWLLLDFLRWRWQYRTYMCCASENLPNTPLHYRDGCISSRIIINTPKPSPSKSKFPTRATIYSSESGIKNHSSQSLKRPDYPGYLPRKMMLCDRMIHVSQFVLGRVRRGRRGTTITLWLMIKLVPGESRNWALRNCEADSISSSGDRFGARAPWRYMVDMWRESGLQRSRNNIIYPSIVSFTVQNHLLKKTCKKKTNAIL